MASQIGIVKALIGTATATSADGSIRNLQVGDSVYADELVSTGKAGAIELEFADGSVMDLGRDTQAMLDNAVFNPEALADTAATAESDVDAIQAAILAGADPTQITEATAAGAGRQADGNEGGQPVVVDYLAPQVTPDSGFDTTGIAVEFPFIEEELQAPIDDAPIVSVSVQVEVQIDPENPDSQPPTDGIPTPEYPLVVTPEGVFILEGTSQVGDSSDPGTRVVAFTLTLDQVYTQDVQVTYTFRPVGADNGANTYGDDWFDGDSPVTVTIPAGTLTFPVYVNIVEDSIVEENGQFEIVLINAVNATINPDASSVMVTIVDDDNTPPVITTDSGNPQGSNDVVYESGLSVGSDPESASEFANGTFLVSDADDISQIVSVTINGETFAIGDLVGKTVNSAHGVLTVTGYDSLTGQGTYSYELATVSDDLAGVEGDFFTLTTNDGLIDSDPAYIFVEIIDDVPTAVDHTPTATPAEDTAVNIDVNADITAGAD
ncbi:MAG: retention module-containing protein, partial [Pseudomonadota bacterium]|nr:retention module-containing protein [Pseudomonadota bacterium]